MPILKGNSIASNDAFKCHTLRYLYGGVATGFTAQPHTVTNEGNRVSEIAFTSHYLKF